MRITSVIVFFVLILLQACTPDGSAETVQKPVTVRSWMPGAPVPQSPKEYWPLPRTEERPTPLHFGLFVTPDPDQNPIDPPERFTGFHAATDFEILPGEEGEDIPVFAICEGAVVYSGFTEGYGGLLVQQCTINDEEVTVLYGHLALDPLPAHGIDLRPGQQLSILADARSRESDGNRKHLHLGVHRGPQLDVRGYVQTENELRNFIDPQNVLPL